MVRSLYKSADLKIESSVTFDLVDGVSESVVHDTPKTATGVARFSKTKI